MNNERLILRDNDLCVISITKTPYIEINFECGDEEFYRIYTKREVELLIKVLQKCL